MNIAGTLEGYRLRRDVPTRRLAKKVGITREGLRLIRRGARIPGVATLEKLIYVLGIPPTVAVELRETALNMRVARMGFVKQKAIEDMWDDFRGELRDDAFVEDEWAVIKAAFFQAAERHLKG